MRKAAFALCLTSALFAACATRPSSNESERPESPSPRSSTGSGSQAEGSGTGGAGQASPTQALEQEAERLSLQEQRTRYLIEQHLASAQADLDNQDLNGAEQELLRALELDADNLQVKNMLRTVGSLKGERFASDAEISQSLKDEYDLRVQQLRTDAEAKVRNAKVHLAREEYDRALTELNLASDAVRWNPYNVSWEDLTQEISSLRNEITTKRDAAQKASREAAEKATLASLRAEEQAEVDRRRELLNNLIEDAIAAFKREDYDTAIDLSERALRMDPRNERAQDIHDTAFRQQRHFVRKEALTSKLEQYKRWEEEIAELRVPNTAIVTLPDAERWKEITELRSKRQGIDFGLDTDPGTLELRQQLAEKTLPSLKIDGVDSLSEVIDSLRLITELPLVVHPAAEAAASDAGASYQYDFTNPLSAEKALNIITKDSGGEVTWTIRHDAILVTTKEKARGELTIRNHVVEDLIFGLTDFLSPRIDRLRLIDEIEDEDGGGLFGAVGEKPVINDPEDLTTLVQENVEPGSWEEDGVSLAIEGGNMIVVHTDEVQAKVRRFLADLRRFSASLVTIESKFMTITDAFIQEIGVDFRGLDNPGTPFTDFDDLNPGSTLGLDNNGSGSSANLPSAGAFYNDGEDGDFKGRTENVFGSDLGNLLSTVGGLTAQWTFLNDIQLNAILRLVEKSQNVELVNDQVLSVYNTQRAYVSVINQRAYVQDFDVEVAQFQAVADPVINVLHEGIVLDVRPTILSNRRYILLEVQPTVARVVSLTDFTTTLAGQTAGVTIQLPELEVQSLFTTATVPDGGSILIGGLSRVRNVERRAEVPWIANVPLVGFFFKREGFSDEKESLMIMLRAWITDVKEELAELER